MDWFQDLNWAEIFRDIGIIVIQLIFIWIGYLIAKSIGKRLINRSFSEVRKKGKITEGRAAVLERLMHSVLSYTLAFIVIVVIFGIFGLPIGGLIAGAGVVGLAIGFGAQGLVLVIVTGFFLLAEKWADVGVYVITVGADGVDDAQVLRMTHIRESVG